MVVKIKYYFKKGYELIRETYAVNNMDLKSKCDEFAKKTKALKYEISEIEDNAGYIESECI